MKINYFENVEQFKQYFIDRVEKLYAVDFEKSNSYQQYVALGSLVSEHISEDWKLTNKYYAENETRSVYYFSMEFLMGRMITNNIMNAGLRPVVAKAFKELKLDLNAIEHLEADAGLGNGGLGRLAACFMDSVASIGLPVHGNCIRYRYGFFEQGVEDGYQVEHPDRWLKDVNVWEVRKDEEAIEIPFFGHVEMGYVDGDLEVKHVDCQYVKAVPYDMPIIGNENGIVNTLRLWSAEPAANYPKNISAFDYHASVREISSMLYPNDSTDEGKLLRLKQQYFFSAAGVNTIVKKHKAQYNTLLNLAEKVCFHINDTHPTLIIPELMRILVDEEKISWDVAWSITKKCCAYTNHTILAEALEKWPVHLFRMLLPRIYSIVEEINRRYCIELHDRFNTDYDKIARMAIIGDNTVRMANLAIVGSFSVNGVAALHTQILKDIEMKDFSDFYPGKFNNKTNGITHRRWCYHTNPELVTILNKYCTKSWVKDTKKMAKLVDYAKDTTVQAEFDKMKKARKVALAEKIMASQGVQLDPNSIFDVQVKRLHEYKRQLLNALNIMHTYNRLKTDAEFKANYHPHSFIFGAKAAGSYEVAKKIIKLINTIADKVNNDPETNQLLKVVFVINYNVSYAEVIMPAADLSEQISTASKEASGTGNMKFMMNGAVTIGTLDGANVEIGELVGDDNIIIFGMDAKEVTTLQDANNYNPRYYYESDDRIREVLDQLTNGFFETVSQDEFRMIKDTLLYKDQYFVLKDFAAYVEAQDKANELYKDRSKWLEMSIMNTAKSGFFSTDRTMEEYNKDIWKLKKVKPLNK